MCYVGIMMAQGDNICNLPSETGLCKAYFPRYYFDEAAGECREFIYGGCGGNANNFETLAECQTTCQEPQTCHLQKEPGLCKARNRRYYFDEAAGKCRRFIYGGCGGNGNNFKTKAECQATCQELQTCHLLFWRSGWKMPAFHLWWVRWQCKKLQN